MSATEDLVPEFLGYKTSQQRLVGILSSWRDYYAKSVYLDLRKTVLGKAQKFDFLPFFAFLVALKAQLEVLFHVNCDHLNCSLAWDKRTGFPSHPSIIGDVMAYVDCFKPSDNIKTLLDSFSGWAEFSQQDLVCCCGRGFKTRTARLNLMLNHLFEVADSGLVIRQLVGVKSDDNDHLASHYELKRQSKVAGDLFIIWDARNAVVNTISQPRVLIHLETQADELFNAEKFMEEFIFPVFENLIGGKRENA